MHTLDTPTAVRLNVLLNELQTAVVDDDLETSADAATKLRALVTQVLAAG